MLLRLFKILDTALQYRTSLVRVLAIYVQNCVFWHKRVYILSQQDQLIALADYEFTRRDANRHSGIDTSKLLKIRMRLTAGADTFQVSETFGVFFVSRSVFALFSNILFYTDNNSERHWIS
jgi:hypothetical protein